MKTFISIELNPTSFYFRPNERETKNKLAAIKFCRLFEDAINKSKYIKIESQTKNGEAFIEKDLENERNLVQSPAYKLFRRPSLVIFMFDNSPFNFNSAMKSSIANYNTFIFSTINLYSSINVRTIANVYDTCVGTYCQGL